MAYRLRYQAHDIELPIGEFLIGRSAECQLALDDPLVSRKHAAFHVRKDGVTVEDLGSRNGVLLNGARVEGPHAVTEDDRVTIGGQDLRVYFVDETVDAQMREQYRRHTQTLGMGAAELEAHLGHAVTSPPPQHPEVTGNARGIQSFSLLGGVADKALAMGRAEEAERILQGLLSDVAQRAKDARDTKPIEPSVSEQAARYAVRLGGAMGKAAWVDYVFELYGDLRRPLPATIVDELYTVVRKIKSLEPKSLRVYLAVLKDVQGSFGPAERFVMQRIEGLDRLISAK